MLCMNLDESLTGVSYAQPAEKATLAVRDSLYETYRGLVSYRYQFTVILGIEVPHRNLLVMERTYYRYMYLQDG